MARNRVRHNEKARQGKRGSTKVSSVDPNAEILDKKAIASDATTEDVQMKDELLGMSGKKRKRFEQFVAKKIKKEERVELLKQLSKSKFDSALLKSSARLGQAKETKKQQLKRALLEEKMGLTPSTNIYKKMEE